MATRISLEYYKYRYFDNFVVWNSTMLCDVDVTAPLAEKGGREKFFSDAGPGSNPCKNKRGKPFLERLAENRGTIGL